jgi:hypothetical protein
VSVRRFPGIVFVTQPLGRVARDREQSVTVLAKDYLK